MSKEQLLQLVHEHLLLFGHAEAAHALETDAGDAMVPGTGLERADESRVLNWKLRERANVLRLVATAPVDDAVAYLNGTFPSLLARNPGLEVFMRAFALTLLPDAALRAERLAASVLPVLSRACAAEAPRHASGAELHDALRVTEELALAAVFADSDVSFARRATEPSTLLSQLLAQLNAAMLRCCAEEAGVALNSPVVSGIHDALNAVSRTATGVGDEPQPSAWLLQLASRYDSNDTDNIVAVDARLQGSR